MDLKKSELLCKLMVEVEEELGEEFDLFGRKKVEAFGNWMS